MKAAILFAPARTAAWDRPFDPAEMLEWLGNDKALISAHTLKGAAGSLTARRLAEAAGALEVLGREASLDNTAVAWSRLEREAHQLLDTLRETDRQFTAEAACAP